MTQEDVDRQERGEDGFIYFPAEMKFDANITFPMCCNFGVCCSFDDGCTFGKDCSFGRNCTFGERCRFDKNCIFNDHCAFGERCIFDKDCGFGQYCNFDTNCKFDEGDEIMEIVDELFIAINVICTDPDGYFDDNGGETDGNSYLFPFSLLSPCEKIDLKNSTIKGHRTKYKGTDEEKEYFKKNAKYWCAWSGGRNEVFFVLKGKI